MSKSEGCRREGRPACTTPPRAFYPIDASVRRWIMGNSWDGGIKKRRETLGTKDAGVTADQCGDG